MSTKVHVNGKEYTSVEEMSPELREAYEKAVRSGAGENRKPQISVESKSYSTARSIGALT